MLSIFEASKRGKKCESTYLKDVLKLCRFSQFQATQDAGVTLRGWALSWKPHVLTNPAPLSDQKRNSSSLRGHSYCARTVVQTGMYILRPQDLFR